MKKIEEFDKEQAGAFYDKMKSLLKKDTQFELSNVKWYKNYKGVIETNDEKKYNLMVTCNKRKLEYNSEKKIIIVDSSSLTIND